MKITPEQQLQYMAMLLTSIVLKHGVSDLVGKSGAVTLDLTNAELQAAQAAGRWEMVQEPIGSKDAPTGLRLKLVRRLTA